MEFHISRSSREKYKFDKRLFASTGNVVFANFQAARQFAKQMNDIRKIQSQKPAYVSPGELNALGMIDEIFHIVVYEYYKENGKRLQSDLYQELADKVGKERLESTLLKFTNLYPPVEVFQQQCSELDYLNGQTNGVPNQEVVLEEMLMTWLTNVNTAADPFEELFSDSDLKKTTAYSSIIDGIKVFFRKQSSFGPEDQDLVSMLRTPAIVEPKSLSGQLSYIREHWGYLLGDRLLRLLGSLDMLMEEQKASFLGPGPTLVPDYSKDALDGLLQLERFSPDSDWMPRVVMIAKNSYVWLNQLSRQFQRQIDRLDQIPDETLDELVRWGFTGLWLIGLWERSEASKTIKQLCGNPDAVASAYSLRNYQIAARLGGEESYYNLSERCGKRGIRLASDMVPNHMGIDSDWLYDHPEWFISQDYSPFPNYSFNGPELSRYPNISINLEDHYYSREDAAVVFKLYNHSNGQTRYIYHGNDGTSMPWNDTAQLNYLMPEVREAVIQTILEVARRFPIIRFDAAMTLTKKHFQRLWFPQPGTGGDIPSRAEHAMTREQFDSVMPEEFWREVVERVAKEVPDTLLLAEAFWLMEGYFVRTLGMHRVYNSAFMNMLRNEENDKYRLLIKNTLVYDPEILKRYVNFMNNPDEKTAVEQFGKGDKYFCICSLMATMPGLPMFGHGQIEGYSEKYGMEYYRPYWDETPDIGLVRHHQDTIFPILHRRKIFANVENFLLYDFITEQGVDENVYAYTNYQDGQAAMVVCNNRFGNSSGWFKYSVQFLQKQGEESKLISKEVFSGLKLEGSPWDYLVFSDYISHLNYIRPLQEVREKGFYFELGAYEHHVFMDFKVVSGEEYHQLFHLTQGKGIADIEQARRELILQPLLSSLGQIINIEIVKSFLAPDIESTSFEERFNSLHALSSQSAQLMSSIYHHKVHSISQNCLINQVRNINSSTEQFGLTSLKNAGSITRAVEAGIKHDPRRHYVLCLYALLHGFVSEDSKFVYTDYLKEKSISDLIKQFFSDIGYSDYEAWKNYQALHWMLNASNKHFEETSCRAIVSAWLEDVYLRDFIEVNEYNGITWFNQEKFDSMLWFRKALTILQAACADNAQENFAEEMMKMAFIFKEIEDSVVVSEYQLDKLMEALH